MRKARSNARWARRTAKPRLRSDPELVKTFLREQLDALEGELKAAGFPEAPMQVFQEKRAQAEWWMRFAEAELALRKKYGVTFAGGRHAEEIARKRGYVVVIGHPRDSTIAVLKEWIPKAKGRGVEIVRVSAISTSSSPPSER